MRRDTLVFSGLLTLLAIGYLVEATHYPFGTMARPGPAVYPILVGGLLLVASLGRGLEVALSRGKDLGVVHWPVGAQRYRFLATVAAVVAYAVLMPRIGHLIAGFVAALLILRTANTHWVKACVWAVVLSGLTYYVFAEVLGVVLP